MTDLYLFLLEQPGEKVHKKIYNVGYENYRVREIAEIVRDTLGGNIPIATTPTNDKRSYHVSSKKIKEELGFEAKHTIEEAVEDLFEAFNKGQLPESFDNEMYFNIKRMQSLNLS